MTTLFTNLGYAEFSQFKYSEHNGYLRYHVRETYPNGECDEYHQTINTHYYAGIPRMNRRKWKTITHPPGQSYLLQYNNGSQQIDLRQVLLNNHTYHYAVSNVCIDPEHHLVITSPINKTIRIPLQDIPELSAHTPAFIAEHIDQYDETLFIEGTDIAISLNGLIEKHTKGTPSYLRRP